MEQIFNIQMMVPLGRRVGTLSFEENEKQNITGRLKLFKNETPFTGKMTSDGEITFSGQLVMLTRIFPYKAQGRVDGSKIKLELVGDNRCFTILGEEAIL